MRLKRYNITISLGFGVILFHFINIAFTGGDDPFIALDHLEKGGLIEAAYKQAQGQGRFYLILTWFLSEFSYYFGFEWASFIKIISTLALFSAYFILIARLFGKKFSIFNSLIVLLFFDWWGGDFNIIHNSPLWYSSGTTFLIISFIVFIKELEKSSENYIKSIIFFGIAILFYEIFLLYVIIYPLAYLIYFKLPLNYQSALTLIKKFKYLFILVIIYLTAYLSFRFYFPSLYEGNENFYFWDPLNSLFTIIRLSVMGIGFKYWDSFSLWIIIKSIVFSLFISISAIHFLSKYSETLINNHYSKSLNFKILGLFICVIIPNILFGFSLKYHTWYGPYVGSSISALALIPIITYCINKIYIQSTNFRYLFFMLFLVISSGIYMNFFYKFQGFKQDKIKLENLETLLNETKFDNNIVPKICTDKNFLSSDSYYIYSYLEKYFSYTTNKKVNFIYIDSKPKKTNYEENLCNFEIKSNNANEVYFITF